MAPNGLDTALIEARSFGRARPGQPGLRRTSLFHSEPVQTVAQPSLRDWTHPLARRWDALCSKAETWLAGRDLAVDLRQDIAARGWFAGLARLMVLLAIASLCAPSFTRLEALPLPLLGDRENVEARAQAIHPLIMGAWSGRHFAATDRVVRLDSVPERATIAVTATLGENDDLIRMLQRIGLASADAEAVRAFTAPLGAPVPGTQFAVTLGPRAVAGEPRPLATLSYRQRFDLEVTVSRTIRGLTLAQRQIPVESTPLHLSGAVGDSLYRAARAAGASPDTVQAYLQAVDQYLPFEAIKPSDQFELVVSHKRAMDGLANSAGQDGDLLYAGIVRDGKPLLQVMRWGNEGNFYTADALLSEAGEGSGLLAAPVAGNITSWFGIRRHPILGFMRMHSGVDFAAIYGTPIFAATDGIVSYAGWHGGHGNYVRLTHGGGIDTGYGHMSRIAVSPGMRVARGQVIGYVGSTGLSTGPHLHYELFRNGQAIDPLSIRFVPHHSVVSPAEVAAFRARLRQLLALPRLGSTQPAG